tara:strand:- start:3416 stop:3916 length:501 start_codon:yes stop_codon:yes gene_type:complete
MIHHSDFVALIASIYKPRVYVELGLYKGETWHKASPHCLKSYGVDVVDRNISGNVFIGTTDDFFASFDKKIDLAFIDADHSYESCKKDFFNCYNRLSDSGIILIHDTDPNDNRLFDKGYCGDSYKIVDFLEKEITEQVNILTLPLTEAGLPLVTKKTSSRTHLRNR